MGHVMGCDPHLDSFTAAVLDTAGRQVDVVARSNSPAGWADALGVARRHGVTAVGIEAASGYGLHLAKAFTRAGIPVMEIPTRLTAQGRQRDGGAKTDRGDARVVARAVLAGEGSRWVDAPAAEALRVLTHRRRALVQAQTREVNQLRALLTEVDPPRAARLGRLRSTKAFTALTQVRYRGDPHRDTVAQLIRDAAAGCRRRLHQIRQLHKRIAQVLPPVGHKLIASTDGLGVIGAATICAEMAGTDGFATDAKFANWAGAAPLEASSGRHQRHRLNRGGNRHVNAVLHTIIVSQRRHRGQAHTYITRRRTEGKTEREAIRALKRHLARTIWKTLQLT